MLLLQTLYKKKPPRSGMNLPSYTARMLVGRVTSDDEKKPIPCLKRFAHFTLGCTVKDEAKSVNERFKLLSERFKDRFLSLLGTKAVQLGLSDHLVWVVMLALSDSDRESLSEAFDPIMCAENNGVLYLWKTDSSRLDGKENRSPHVTIGPTEKTKT